MNPKLTAISKEVSYALRHRPDEYGLELDERGFVEIEDLLAALNAKDPGRDVTRADLECTIAESDKKRHEIVSNRIRAAYGHSTGKRVEAEPAVPPADLYHGTSRAAATHILAEGIKPMGRQYAHLSADVETAMAVGARHDSKPALLKVDAAAAHAAGVAFYRGNDKVWLADRVPAEFVERVG